MSNLLNRFNNAAPVTPHTHIPQTRQNDPFQRFATHDLTSLVDAATNALRHRRCPPPLYPPPYMTANLTYPPPITSPGSNGASQTTRPIPPPPLTERPTQQHTIQPMPSVPPRPADMWENAKIEQIICAGLKPPYDGSPDLLIPTMNLINIRRRNEVWFPATFVIQDNKKVDLVTQFSQVKRDTVLNSAKTLWEEPNALLNSHTRGTPTYNSRLLGIFLMNSLTSDFAALLHTRIDSTYCSDGPLLLHTLCQHIHRNHRAFVESIKSKIRSSTLPEHNNDVPKYLRFLGENLKLISSTGVQEHDHDDLIPHIFLQLRTTTIPIFQQSILKWQREYFENNLDLTPQTLVTKADQECQVLTHAGQWMETIDPSIVAMKATLQTNAQHSGELFKTLVANYSNLRQRHKEHGRSTRPSTRPPSKSSGNHSPEWIYDCPAYPDQIKHYNNRYWHFCTKCHAPGKWVCTHTTETHDDSILPSRRSSGGDFDGASTRRSRSPARDSGLTTNRHSRRFDSRSRSRSPGQHTYSSPSASPTRKVTWQYPAPPTPVAQLSLLDSLNVFLSDDE
jgi:hypothetical protein